MTNWLNFSVLNNYSLLKTSHVIEAYEQVVEKHSTLSFLVMTPKSGNHVLS